MKRDLLRGLGRWGIARSRLGSSIAVTAISLLAFCPAASASASTTIRISNDGGGSISARVSEIRNIRSLGQKVEIQAGYCNSACTLYLGLPNTCVSPNARFGFHGPQLATKGLTMLPSQFEKWSQIMADHYPQQLRHWFMNSARHSTDLITVKGDQLFALGISHCA